MRVKVPRGFPHCQVEMRHLHASDEPRTGQLMSSKRVEVKNKVAVGLIGMS